MALANTLPAGGARRQSHAPAATNSVVAQGIPFRLWVKEDRSFINVREVLPDNKLSDIRIYQFDDKFNLRKSPRAESGEFLAGNDWRLHGITETTRYRSAASIWHTGPTAERRTALNPNILSVLLVAPSTCR